MKTVYLTLVFSIFLLPLNAITSSFNGRSQEEVAEVELPNPLNLQANWPQYFNVDEDEFDARVASLSSLLQDFYEQLETQEEKEEAARAIQNITLHLESLKHLKQQVVEAPKLELAWIPKSSYQLDEYIEISGQIRELRQQIDFLKSDLTQTTYTISNLSQTYSNTYARYLRLDGRTKQKFFLGLEVLSLGTRRLYLQAEERLDREIVAANEERLAVHTQKRKVMKGELRADLDLQAIEREQEDLRLSQGRIQQKITELETRSIQRHDKLSANGEARLVDQRLLNAQIEEALINAQLFFLDAKTTLAKALNSPEEIQYEENVRPIRTFRTETENLMDSWQEVASAGMDQISQKLIAINDENEEEQRAAYREALDLSVSTQTLLQALSVELYHIRLVNELILQNITRQQSTVDRLVFNFERFWQGTRGTIENWLYYSLFEVGGIPITLIGLLRAALIVLASFWVSNFIGRSTQKFAKGSGKVGEPTLYTFRRIFHYIIIFLGILLALGSLGLTMGNLAIVLGALGIGLGFGLQNIVNNFLCGLVILFERNVKVGDIVELEEGLIGKVVEVNVQNTTLHTFDSLDVLVPNSSVVGKNVINWTKNSSFLRYHVPFTVAYGTDQNLVTEAVCEAALKVGYTLTDFPGIPEPDVWLVKFGDNALHYELIVWVDLKKPGVRKGILAAYLSEIEFALKKHNINIPFPQRDLHIKSVPEEGIYIRSEK